MRTQQLSHADAGARPFSTTGSPTTARKHRTPRRSSIHRSAVIGVATALLVTIAALSYLIGTQAAGAVAPQAPATAAPATVAEAPPAVAVAPPAEDGPVLVDRAGVPLPSAMASVVRQVYDALALSDLETIRQAYSAGGSDDWHTSSPHLLEPAVRAALLETLETTPSHGDGNYTYADDPHSLIFAVSAEYGTSGLIVIDGPWNAELADAASTGDRPSSADTITADRSTPTPTCTEGTDPTPTEGYSCTDSATGAGVGYDGTAGVHGLGPCPPGTTVPDDPDEPTRDSSTGEICALY